MDAYNDTLLAHYPRGLLQLGVLGRSGMQLGPVRLSLLLGLSWLKGFASSLGFTAGGEVEVTPVRWLQSQSSWQQCRSGRTYLRSRMRAMDPIPAFPARFAPGTLVGPWRLVALAGRGSYGEVYRAVRADMEPAPPVALKLAMRPWDSRFTREVTLLSQLHHPSIPRLVDQGVWRPEGGAPHPFLVMQWVDGEPLYSWAQRQPPRSLQVLRLLGQLTRALEALHAVGGVHRDVKGDNVLVRREDGRAVLTDFGSGVPLGASTLTPPGTFVGTQPYRSPESWLFELQSLRQPEARYTAGPADDVFALGVTACRLLTGQYPEPGEPTQDPSGTWHLETLVLPPALQQVEKPLRSLVLRMLSVHPEQRGTAAELAQALEAAAQGRSGVPPARRRHWLAAAAVAVCLGLGGMWTVPHLAEQVPHLACADSSRDTEPGTGTQGLGKAAITTSREPPPESAQPQALAEEALPEPRPGQARVDSKGRCPHKKQIALNGACWGLMEADEETCEGFGGYLFKKACYVPFFPPRPSRPPTSHPAREQ